MRKEQRAGAASGVVTVTVRSGMVTLSRVIPMPVPRLGDQHLPDDHALCRRAHREVELPGRVAAQARLITTSVGTEPGISGLPL